MTILTASALVPADDLRARFAAAMSTLYQAEVPLYGRLLDLVRDVNAAASVDGLEPWIDRPGLAGERHGAIRLGTADELRQIADAFAILGMMPVDYYDLAPVGLPVHSTAFRPIDAAGLAVSPFRIFTSLLRIDLIEPAELRREAEAILSRRRIIHPDAADLTARARQRGGLTEEEAARFLPALIETFRWHAEASVSADVYAALAASHGLVADVVSFRGPHINHLTPRVLDIDAAQARMAAEGFNPKTVIEGPPRRACPILLRQTSFKALEEPIAFPDADGTRRPGVHTARFGEIEQRGAALTAAGRTLYDRWIAEKGDLALPDDWKSLWQRRLAFFRFKPGHGAPKAGASVDELVDSGALTVEPILYEDFLPVSAAGIFRSNLSNEGKATAAPQSDRAGLEATIGRPILDSATLYAAAAQDSLTISLAALRTTVAI